CRIRFRAVSLYRSKFTERLAGAVLNSYPNVDLPWDNVYAGAMGMAPLYSASASPGPSPTLSAGRGRFYMPTGGVFNLEMQPRAGPLDMKRPQTKCLV